MNSDNPQAHLTDGASEAKGSSTLSLGSPSYGRQGWDSNRARLAPEFSLLLSPSDGTVTLVTRALLLLGGQDHEWGSQEKAMCFWVDHH